MSQQTAETFSSMSAKASPPAIVVGAKLIGMPIADWIQWLTFIYLLLMIGQKCWHLYKEWKTGTEVKDAD